MQGTREFWSALTTALLSIVLTLGSLSISLVGFEPEENFEPTNTAVFVPLPVTATHTLPPTFTPLVAIDTPTATATHTLIPMICQAPSGWISVIVQSGDTLDGLASRYQTSKELLRTGNCLLGNENLIVGKGIFVPQVVNTSTPFVCTPGKAGWIKGHTVVKGDTFYNIGARYGYSATEIKAVNCRTSDLIYVGEVLYVPNAPTRTPTNTPLPGVTFTAAPSLTQPFTQTPPPFTLTPVATKTSVTQTPSPVPSATAVPTQTASPTQQPVSTNTP